MSVKSVFFLTFFLIFFIFYIFEGFSALKIPFFVNFLTKFQKYTNFISLRQSIFVTCQAGCSTDFVEFALLFLFLNTLYCRTLNYMVFYIMSSYSPIFPLAFKFLTFLRNSPKDTADKSAEGVVHIYRHLYV